MGYAITQQGDTVEYNVYSITCDTLADKNNLPLEKFGAGSTVLVLQDSSVWVLGTDGILHEL